MSYTYKFNKEKITFSTDMEKVIHKTISSIRYGEKISLSCSPKNKEERDDIVWVIKKSACYNNIEIKAKWKPDFKSINIIHQI